MIVFVILLKSAYGLDTAKEHEAWGHLISLSGIFCGYFQLARVRNIDTASVIDEMKETRFNISSLPAVP